MRPSGATVIDHVLGGFPPGLPLVLAGASGSGRTVLGLQLAHAALGRGEVVQFVSSEPAESLIQQALALGFDFERALAEDRLVLLELDATTPTLVRSQGVDPLVEALRGEASRVDLLVVDPFTAITAEIADEPRLREVSRGFVRAVDVETLVLTVESERLAQQRGLERVLSELCGAYLTLDREPGGRRTLSVEKSRTGVAATERVEFAIAPGGAHLVGDATPKAAIPLVTRVRRLPVEGRAAATAGGGTDPEADLALPATPIAAPTPRRSAARSATTAPAAEPARARPLVLLVEDNRMQRELVSDWLSPRWDVLTAADGFDALAKIVSQQPDLVILDLIMPRVSGQELLCALRRSRIDVPVLVTSSRVARAGDRLGPLVLGATDFLPKPLGRLELEHKVETLLRLRRDGAPAPVPFDADTEALFGRVSATRILEATEFRERVLRAHEFGERNGLPSSLVRVRAPDTASLDALIETAEAELRFEDAMLRVNKQRALVLLVATGPADAPQVMERLLERADAGRGFKVEVGPAQPDPEDPEALERPTAGARA